MDRNTSQKLNRLKKITRLHERYRELHEVDRLRLDDVIARLSEEFFWSEMTVMRYLAKPPEEQVIFTEEQRNQLDLFMDKPQEDGK